MRLVAYSGIYNCNCDVWYRYTRCNQYFLSRVEDLTKVIQDGGHCSKDAYIKDTQSAKTNPLKTAPVSHKWNAALYYAYSRCKQKFL